MKLVEATRNANVLKIELDSGAESIAGQSEKWGRGNSANPIIIFFFSEGSVSIDFVLKY